MCCAPDAQGEMRAIYLKGESERKVFLLFLLKLVFFLFSIFPSFPSVTSSDPSFVLSLLLFSLPSRFFFPLAAEL